jgi:hypothetical protein
MEMAIRIPHPLVNNFPHPIGIIPGGIVLSAPTSRATIPYLEMDALTKIRFEGKYGLVLTEVTKPQ